MPDLVRAVDCSAYTGEVPGDAWDYLGSQGVGLVIVQLYGGGPAGVGPNPYARQQLETALASGKRVAGYAWPPAAWAEGWDQVPSRMPLEFLSLDVEEGQPVGLEHELGVRAAGLEPWIYTSRSQWLAVMGDSDLFSHLPLWDAVYPPGLRNNGWPYELHTSFRPYGGWTSRAGWQFRGTTDLGGKSFDLNVFDPSYLEKEDLMKLRLVRGDESEAIYAINCSGRAVRILDMDHLNSLIELGLVENQEPQVVPQIRVDAIPDAAGERP